MTQAGETLAQFLTDVGDAPEVIWAAALAMLRAAVAELEEAPAKFRHHPKGSVRRLREELARSLKLARLAAAMQEELESRDRDLVEALHAEAVEAGKARRRAQTLPAELARLEKQRRRRAGLPTENFHLRADYAASGLAAAEGGEGAGGRDSESLEGREAGARGRAARGAAKRPRGDVQADDAEQKPERDK